MTSCIINFMSYYTQTIIVFVLAILTFTPKCIYNLMDL